MLARSFLGSPQEAAAAGQFNGFPVKETVIYVTPVPPELVAGQRAPVPAPFPAPGMAPAPFPAPGMAAPGMAPAKEGSEY